MRTKRSFVFNLAKVWQEETIPIIFPHVSFSTHVSVCVYIYTTQLNSEGKEMSSKGWRKFSYQLGQRQINFIEASRVYVPRSSPVPRQQNTHTHTHIHFTHRLIDIAIPKACRNVHKKLPSIRQFIGHKMSRTFYLCLRALMGYGSGGRLTDSWGKNS